MSNIASESGVVNIIQEYALIVDKRDEEVKIFYEDLIKKHNITMVLGDFNA